MSTEESRFVEHTIEERRRRFAAVRDAVLDGLNSRNYQAIDDFVKDDIALFTQVNHSRTPIFDAVDRFLAEIPDSIEGHTEQIVAHKIEAIVDLLEHFFENVMKKINNNQATLHDYVHLACNHISHTDQSAYGFTLRDLINHYWNGAGPNITHMQNDSYDRFNDLAQEVGMYTKRAVRMERIRPDSSEPGVTL